MGLTGVLHQKQVELIARVDVGGADVASIRFLVHRVFLEMVKVLVLTPIGATLMKQSQF